jgi:prepilin-type N-terminal cleavage/methylation domain-containing protein
MTYRPNNQDLPATLGAPSKRRGFTLVEMITVLTIMVLLLSIAIPVWKALLGGTNTATAQNQIAAMLANARSDAMYYRQTIGVFFFPDLKSGQTAMAEVQVQTLYYNSNAGPGSSTGYTSQFSAGKWQGTPPAWTRISTTGPNGLLYSLEMVNYVDPNFDPTSNQAPNYIFYRDLVFLPKGVGVVLNNNTYDNNTVNNSGAGLEWTPQSNPMPPLDRYRHIGAIMFTPDGRLTTIPFGVPYYEYFNQAQYNLLASNNKVLPENQLCARIGMYYNYDLASNLNWPPNPGVGNPPYTPLMSSVGLVIFDHDAYLSQHARLAVGQPQPQSSITIGDNSLFTDDDLNWSSKSPPTGINPGANSIQAQDKFIEESWIDQNGVALMVNPMTGALLKAK